MQNSNVNMVCRVKQWDVPQMIGSRKTYVKTLSLPNTAIPLVDDHGLKITVDSQEYNTDFERWEIAGHFTGDALKLSDDELLAKGWECRDSSL